MVTGAIEEPNPVKVGIMDSATAERKVFCASYNDCLYKAMMLNWIGGFDCSECHGYKEDNDFSIEEECEGIVFLLKEVFDDDSKIEEKLSKFIHLLNKKRFVGFEQSHSKIYRKKERKRCLVRHS